MDGVKAPSCIHVLPVDDVREHVEDGPTCWCAPTLKDGRNEWGKEIIIVVHNPMDGRELVERHASAEFPPLASPCYHCGQPAPPLVFIQQRLVCQACIPVLLEKIQAERARLKEQRA